MRDLGAHADVQQTQRAMVFVDGTNLFYRLASAKLRLLSLAALIRYAEPYREIVRVYLYTTQPHHEKAQGIHGRVFADGVRVVYGEAIATRDGNHKEKGVDAQLVADLVYHAAARNCEKAILISSDQDFAHALARVEDFGCRTSVISVIAPTPRLLKDAADSVVEMDAQLLLEEKLACEF